MRRLNKLPNHFWVKQVGIRLPVKPWVDARDFNVSIPERIRIFAVRPIRIQTPVTLHPPLLVQRNCVDRQQSTVIAANVLPIGAHFKSIFLRRITQRLRREDQDSRTAAFIAGNVSPSEAGRPAIFIIKPGAHAVLLGPHYTMADPSYKRLLHVRQRHARPGMEMGAAHSHLPEHICHEINIPVRHRAVPGPERRTPVFCGRIQKICIIIGMVFLFV